MMPELGRTLPPNPPAGSYTSDLILRESVEAYVAIDAYNLVAEDHGRPSDNGYLRVGVDDDSIAVNGASPKNNASVLSAAEKHAFVTLLQPTASVRPGQGWHRVGPSDFEESDRWRSAASRAAASAER